ncbi:MAG: DUF2911 domain-containing protein [Bacteroidia bacterium]|nr:DUF2911 domain-containing protein [Bacteroidia bacterium]
MKKSIATLAVAALAIGGTAQTLKTPAPSPTQTLKQNFALNDITIEYSRPSVKGRIVFGDLVPYDKLWRTGANASTKIAFTDNVTIEGNTVPAGTYSLFTIPGKTEWTIILNKNISFGGTGDYKQEEDQLRFKAKPTALADNVETFTINVADIKPTTATIELTWEKTRVAFAVTANIDSTVMKNIESVMSPADKRPYFQAASYYYNNGKDMKKALEWASKAVDLNPKAYYMIHLKAKIQMDLKDYKGAITTAEQSMAMAKEAKSDDYIKLNEKLIAEAKKAK